MPLRHYKPTSPGRRNISGADFSQLTKKEPEKSLVRGRKRLSGRDSAGRVSIRHRGGGHKRLARLVDFRQQGRDGIPGKIVAVEYDPNRSARILLVQYADGQKRYILAAEGLRCGDTVVSAPQTKVKTGNRMQLRHIPVGYKVYNVELQIGRGGQIVRSAGTAATLLGFDGEYALLQLPSTEVRKVRRECMANIGTLSNAEHNLVRIGKAGRSRWLGRRPEVLGKSMNAVDHPHGGGEGHSPIGLPGPKTPWGKPALGVKTRKKKRFSNACIVRRRLKKLRKK